MKRLSWKKPFLKLKGCMLRQVTIERLNIQKEKKEKKTKPRCNFSLHPRMQARFALCSFSGDQLCSLTFVTLTALARRISPNLAESGISQSRLKFFETVPFRRDLDPVLDPSMVRWGIANASKALDWLARRTCKIYCTDIQEIYTRLILARFCAAHRSCRS